MHAAPPVNIAINLDDIDAALRLLTALKENLTKGTILPEVRKGTIGPGEEKGARQVVEAYKPNPDSLLDVVCSDKRTLYEVLGVLRSIVRDKVTLYFSEKGAVARIVDKAEGRMLDIDISKDFFKTYHVKDAEHVKVVLPAGVPAYFLRKRSTRDFHFLIGNEDASELQFGPFGLEYAIRPVIEHSTKDSFPAEQRLPEPEPEAMATVPFSLAREMVQSFWQCSDVAVAFEKGRLAFQAVMNERKFSKTLTMGQDGVALIMCRTPSSCRFDARKLMPLMRNGFGVTSSLHVVKYPSVLCLKPAIDKIKLCYYVAIKDQKR